MDPPGTSAQHAGAVAMEAAPGTALDIGIIAHDFPRMRTFYEGVLGLEHAGTLGVPWGTLHRFRFAASMIKIVDPAAPTAAGGGGLDAMAGIRYLTFRIDNVEDVWQQATAAGATVFRELMVIGADGAVGMLFDPDGNVLELIRFPADG